MKRKLSAPQHLSPESKRFWRQTVEDYDLEAHHLKILQSALECWDRILEARNQLEADGAFYEDRFGQPREHPAAKTERDNRVIHARLLRELGFDLCDPDPPKLN